MLISHIKNCAILKNGKSGKPIDPIISNSNCANNVHIVDLFESFAGPSWILSILWGSEVRQEKLHLKDPPLVRTISYIYISSKRLYWQKQKGSVDSKCFPSVASFLQKRTCYFHEFSPMQLFFCQLSQHSLAAFSLPWGHFVLARYDNPHGPHGAWFSKIPSFGTASNWGMQPSSLCHVSMTPVWLDYRDCFHVLRLFPSLIEN